MTLIRIKKHQYLVSLIAISKKGDEYYLLIDYCEGGNLFELLHRRTDIEVPWKTRIKIAKQVAIAMNYLHNCQPQIIHRDLKSLKYNPLSTQHPNIEKVQPHRLEHHHQGHRFRPLPQPRRIIHDLRPRHPRTFRSNPALDGP
jgi:serine/threonine protein kinase